MSDPITINDIYDLFRATQETLRASQAEYDRRAEEADRRLAKLEKSVANSRCALNLNFC